MEIADQFGMKNSSTLQNKKILVVDDEADLRDIVAMTLEFAGASVAQAENGEIGRLLVEKNKYDLVISDVRMPRMDGIGLLRAVKEMSPETRVILYTGYSEVLQGSQATDLGAHGFISKPFSMDILVEMVEALLPAKLKLHTSA